MKLVLKRVGDDPRLIRRLGDLRPPEKIEDYRPFGLHTEDGTILPCQISTSMSSESGGPAQVTVVFMVNGRDLIVEGDPV